MELENNALRSRLEVTSANATSKAKDLEDEAGILKAGGCNETHAPDAPSLVDYAKAVEANTTLKERLAKARNLNQQWAQFYRSKGRESADRKLSSLKDYPSDSLSSKGREPEDKKPSILKEDSPDCVLSKLQAQIDRAVTSPKSLSYDSKPAFSSEAGPETPLQQKPPLDSLPPHNIAPENEVRPLQDPHETHPSLETDEPSETGEDSQNYLSLQSETPLKTAKVDRDSESPIIVSERSLRRKRKSFRRSRNQYLPEDTQAQLGTMKKPFTVKSEPNSSSPSTHVSHLTSTNPQDSMDLDEVGERRFTPRKRRRLLDEGLSLMSVQTEAHNSDDFQDQTLVTETDEEADCEELAGFKTQGRRHDFEVGDELRILSRINPAEGPSQTILDKPREVILAASSILRAKDPNVQPRPSKRSFLKALNRALSQSRRSTASNAPGFQDGREDCSKESDRHSLKEQRTTVKSHKAHHAIDNHQPHGHISPEPSPRKSLIDSVAKSKKATWESKGPGKVTKTYSRSMTEKGHIPRSIIQKPNAIKSRRSFPVPADEPDEPDEPDDPDKTLIEQKTSRSKSRKFLSFEDFKINPIHNHGYAHPVSEVVRNRDQRSCMPGCTRPNCCGNAIRKAVAMGGHFPAPKKSGFSKDIPFEDDPGDDERCLQVYLGDDYPRLKNLPWEDKEELLWAARTEQFANAYGKHRYQYGRQQTPPGFWDADMPSTQQEVKNKTIAKAMQKAKISEMHREAMKPGGRYKFRDE